MILYDWTTNEILSAPIKDTKYETIIKAFQTYIKYITKRGFKPSFNTIDNVSPKAIKVYLQEENTQMQLFETHNHQVNAAERSIQIFKNNLIAGLSIGDEKFPNILCSYPISQAQDSLNLIRTSRAHPQLLAYQVLEGTHDFNRHPWAPPVKRAIVFNSPEIISSWEDRALEAWYLDPAWNHYRCLKLQVPTTGGIRVSGQYKLYPQHSHVPIEKPKDEATRISRHLIEAVKGLQDQ